MTEEPVVIEAQHFKDEEEELKAIPMVRSMAAAFAVDVLAGNITREYLDTHAAMGALGIEFQRRNIPYHSIGGPIRAFKVLVDHFLGEFDG